MIKLTFATDLDDCLLRTSTYIEYLMREKYGVYINPEEVKNYGYEYCIPKTQEWVIQEAIQTALEHSERIKPVENAFKRLKDIFILTDKLYIISRRPKYLYDLTNRVIKHHLRDSWENSFKLMFSGKDNKYKHKYEIILDYEIDWMVEDKAETVERIIQNTTDTKVLLHTRPWNESYKCKDRAIRVRNWDEIYNILLVDYIRRIKDGR